MADLLYNDNRSDAARAFLADLQKVCDDHGLQLGHEDEHGGFIVMHPQTEPEADHLKQWLADAFEEQR